VPDTRFTLRFVYDAESLDDAKNFARGLRRVSRERNANEWERRDARLLRVKAPEGYTSGMFRAEAVVKFNASSHTDAQVFGREVRQAGKGHIAAARGRYGRYSGNTLRQWAQRDAKLLRIVDPNAVAVVAEQAAPAPAVAEAPEVVEAE
jgi:hypothetical protein